MERGYVKLWRKSLDSSTIKNSNLWLFWCFCLLKASHKKHKVMIGFQEIELEPGQFVFGRKKASKEIPLTQQNIRTCLKILEKSQNLTIKSTNKYSIITVNNWSIYQSKVNNINHQINHEVTSNQPASNQQVTTYKKDKNVKNGNNEKNEKTHSKKIMSGHKQKRKKINKVQTYTESFMRFWEIYPKKVNKSGAFESWESLAPDEKLITDIINAINLQVKYKIIDLRENKKYCPHPATWLNQKRWHDEIEIEDPMMEIGGMKELIEWSKEQGVIK